MSSSACPPETSRIAPLSPKRRTAVALPTCTASCSLFSPTNMLVESGKSLFCKRIFQGWSEILIMQGDLQMPMLCIQLHISIHPKKHCICICRNKCNQKEVQSNISEPALNQTPCEGNGQPSTYCATVENPARWGCRILQKPSNPPVLYLETALGTAVAVEGWLILQTKAQHSVSSNSYQIYQ